MSEPDFYLGETWTIPGHFLNSEGGDLPLTGATLTARFYTSQGVQFTLTVGDGIAIDNALGGRYTMTVTPLKQTVLDDALRVIFFDVKVVLANGQVVEDSDNYLRLKSTAFQRWA